MRRINTRQWKPGDQIPNEVDLAAEFGCARTTVNRALREIAKTGLLDRKRKAGTRVVEQPIARAVFEIPIIRKEIEARGQAYRHQVQQRAISVAPSGVLARMGLNTGTKLLRLKALHLANSHPYAYEDRWVNLHVAPEARDEPFDTISANEWLVLNTPYTNGEVSFSAASASKDIADALNCDPGSALLAIDRLTWYGPDAVTHVRIVFAEGHQLHASL